MTDFVRVEIDDKELMAGLNRLSHAGADLSGAMRKIAQTLVKVTEDNFAAQGRPKWAPLSEATIHQRIGGKKAYKKNGELTAAATRRRAGLLILQDSGSMAGSVSTDSSATHAVIGSNKQYANIQQFGGQAGRGLKVTIPARPWLPVTADKQLQPEAVPEVLAAIMRHLRNAI